MPKQSSLMENFERIIESNPTPSLLKQKIYHSSVIFSIITTGIRNLFMMVASIFHTNKILPLASFILKIFITFSKTLETLFDLKKSIQERLIALAILVLIATFSIISFVYGYLVAASLSLIIAVTVTVLDGIEWGKQVHNKITAGKAYPLKIEDLKNELHMANQKFALSSTSFFMDLASVALAAITLALALGSAYLAPVIIILGITLTTINLIHFIVEQCLQYQAAKLTKAALKNSEGSIFLGCDSPKSEIIEQSAPQKKSETTTISPPTETLSFNAAKKDGQTNCTSVTQAGFFYNPTCVSHSAPAYPNLFFG